MSNKAIDMEASVTGSIPTNIKGREVNPDKDEVVVAKKIVSKDEHMNAILEHIPKEMKERVAKLGREELAMPGIPMDRQAYDAYLGAEKILRDATRRKAKADLSFNNLKKQNG